MRVELGALCHQPASGTSTAPPPQRALEGQLRQVAFLESFNLSSSDSYVVLAGVAVLVPELPVPLSSVRPGEGPAVLLHRGRAGTNINVARCLSICACMNIMCM